MLLSLLPFTTSSFENRNQPPTLVVPSPDLYKRSYPTLPHGWIMDQAPVFGQLRPSPPFSTTPHFGATLGAIHSFRNISLLAAVFHVFLMFYRFRVQPFSAIYTVGQDGRPRGIKARAARTPTELLTYDFWTQTPMAVP